MNLPSFPFSARAALAVAALLTAVTQAGAGPVWQQTNNLSSNLGEFGGFTYSSAAQTGIVTYTGQHATNTGPTSQHMGMYIGWVWTYDSSGAATSLLWDNGTNAFVGSGISLTVERVDVVPQLNLLLSDVVDDTWIGTPWTPGAPAVGIATQGSWNVPFLDFGEIAAGGFATYDIRFRVSFANAAAFNDWDAGGSFYIGGQGVEVPEPATLALAGLALLGAGLARRTAPRYQRPRSMS